MGMGPYGSCTEPVSTFGFHADAIYQVDMVHVKSLP